MAQSLADFVHAVSGDDHLCIEENLGEGFVRLKTAEAERRQAMHDIRSVEDIVVEMLRNSRDAHASTIYLSSLREGNTRTLVFLDDGDGVPESLHERIFEPRVTSKLETMTMDKWGVHGRGMALYSIRCNTEDSSVVASGHDLGASIKVRVDLNKLGEKTDQSTYPSLGRDEDDNVVVSRGPHNTIRNVVEFALEHKDKVTVYYGTPAEIVARMYEDGRHRLSDDQLLFCDDVDDLPISLRPSACADASEMVRVCASIGLPISERTAHRVLAGQMELIQTPLSKVIDAAKKPARQETHGIKRSMKITDDDLAAFRESSRRCFQTLADRYYLELKGEPKVRVGKDYISVKFPIDNV